MTPMVFHGFGVLQVRMLNVSEKMGSKQIVQFPILLEGVRMSRRGSDLVAPDLMTCLQEIRRGRPENLHAEELNVVHNSKTTTPVLNPFGVLVPPDWNAAGLEVVRVSIQNYFAEMSEDKVHAWHVFSPETQQSMPIIGSIGSRRLGICAGSNDLHPGMLAVVYTEEKTSRPWIGKITSVEEKEVTIHWYQGTYEKSWNPMTGVENLSTVPRESLLLWGFTLTDYRQLLRSETREELKRLHQETDQIMQPSPGPLKKCRSREGRRRRDLTKPIVQWMKIGFPSSFNPVQKDGNTAKRLKPHRVNSQVMLLAP
ncbi:unnamed protein product [Darwinula stevensoni]|uniref:Uncharacterized protein n=1 Tax=Darwinula stevensoni TaxID=69355 RepID=A0A7R9AE54_9CRUS|nr:unnamed protein product [Darwinula stevensoni]CAG0901998.1 unnamed protein product [Darwinula stevensoni]